MISATLKLSALVSVLAMIPCASCSSYRAASQDAPLAETPVKESTPTNSVSYKGVTFTYDPSLASHVTSETVAASVDGKPCDIWPEHPAFSLSGYPPLVHAPNDFAQIRVFELAKFRDAMRIAGEAMGKSTVPPSKERWSKDVDAAVSVLKKLIAERPDKDRVKSVIGKKHTGIGCYGIPQIPFLPEWEACQPFVAHVRYVDFKNGKGIFFLTEWMTETEQISNQRLEYAFQGITNDGRYWVYAEFSVFAPGLPRGDEAEFIAWAEKHYLLSYKSQEFQSYLEPVVAKLEALQADRFQPNLELLERLIESLEVQPK